MTTMYTVVRYVPDTTAGEFVNVGVIVWGDGTVRARFVANWKRIEDAGGAVALLDRFVARFVSGAEHPVTEEVLVGMIDAWGGAIQFSPATPAMASPEETLDAVARDFLRPLASPPRDWQKPYPDNPNFLIENRLSVGR